MCSTDQEYKIVVKITTDFFENKMERDKIHNLHGKCWPFVAEDGGSIDTLNNKLGVNDLKCEDWCPGSNHTSNSISLTQWEARGATRLEDIELGFTCLNHSFNPSFQESLTVPN